MLGERLRRWERICYVVILLLAIFSRFYILGERAISHDESIHTKFSWNLYSGQGFQHSPMMHGPLLFEATAFNYLLFGANDFTSRIFTALVGVVLVMTPLLFRKWMGRWGAVMCALLLLISPSISYYSRYIRHDAPLMLTAVLWLWAMMKYLESGKARWLYWLAAFFSLMYTTKEASYIYTAIFIALLTVPFAWQVIRVKWRRPEFGRVVAGVVALTLVTGLIFGFAVLGAPTTERSLDEGGDTLAVQVEVPWWGRVAVAIAFIAALSLVVLLTHAVGKGTMHRSRLFDLLMVIGTLTLPLGTAFLLKFVGGVDMLTISEVLRSGNLQSLSFGVIFATFAILGLMLAGSVALGMWWDSLSPPGTEDRWPMIALIHYAIFLVTYTTIFTWGVGALSGLIGSLAYWMAQQGVARGSQPWYYYLMLGPLYEYLALIFSAVGGVGAIVYALRRDGVQDQPEEDVMPHFDWQRLFPLLLLGWTLASWFAYTYAGEKMPWLIVHITLPSVFLAAWGLGRIVRGVAEREIWIERRGWVFVAMLPLAVISLAVLGDALGAVLTTWRGGFSEAGPTLAQLEPFGVALGGLLGLIGCTSLLVWIGQKLGPEPALRLAGVTLALALGLLTVRTMVMLNYINHDMATEFLVYAHGAPDIKVALEQIEEISWRTTGTADQVKVAYGEDGSWPFTWYMVDYPNNYFYGQTPDREKLLACSVIIAGAPQWEAVEAILGADYLKFDYKYLWWPIQDYYGMTWERIVDALTDPGWRKGLWDIIWARDYRAYAQYQAETKSTPDNEVEPFTVQTWPHRKEFRLYIRRDLAQKMWSYQLGPEGGPEPVPQETAAPDPYTVGERVLEIADKATLTDSAARGMAIAADGTLYVADTSQHRVVQITPQGAILSAWGSYGAEPGQFSEPWDVAVDPAGNVYVADTWNHRVQKFDAQGNYLLSWGALAQVGELGDPGGQGVFFGPRGIAVDPEGRDGPEIYVTDTGNKRVQVFDAEGAFLREFGGGGAALGQLSEPVGIAISEQREVYVADTWNRRVQVFTPEGVALRSWDIPAWRPDNPEEKPFLAVDAEHVYVSDAAHRRVLAFTRDGGFRWALGGGTTSGVSLLFPEGVAVDEDSGILYVADPYAQQVIGYLLPETINYEEEGE
ncbi:MAG: flippase activity-associated protein Agl23 [Anaerolineales bacterium]